MSQINFIVEKSKRNGGQILVKPKTVGKGFSHEEENTLRSEYAKLGFHTDKWTLTSRLKDGFGFRVSKTGGTSLSEVANSLK